MSSNSFWYSLTKVYFGQRYWRKIQRKPDYSAGNVAIMLFLSGEDECCHYSLTYLNEFLEKNGYVSAFILTNSKWVEENYRKYNSKTQRLEKISTKNCDKLITLYEWFHFDRNFYLISLHKPYGRDQCLKLPSEDSKLISHLVKRGIYGIIDDKIEVEDS